MTEIGCLKTVLDTPFLWADLDRLERNVAEISGFLAKAGVNWRPHTKGIKTPAIAHMMLRAGAIGVTCAKLGEAEVMAAAGIRDILIANQVVGRQKYTRLAYLSRTVYVKIAVDSENTLPDLDEAAESAGVQIALLIELNTGMNRAGVQPGEPVLALARAIGRFTNLKLLGLMTWEGHTLSIQNTDEKQKAIARSVRMLTDSVELCRANGIPIEIVSCGGSGTYMYTALLPGVTEVQAGGAVFNDVTYAKMGVKTEQALYVHTVVTSRPAADRIIVDAGFKTLPKWVNPAAPVGIDDVADITMSAEHGIITLSQPNDSIHVGDRLDFVVGYGDTTVFLHDTLYGVRNGVVEAVWPTSARGKLR